MRAIKQSSGCHATGSSCLRGVKLLYLSWIRWRWKPGGREKCRIQQTLAYLSSAAGTDELCCEAPQHQDAIFFYDLKLWAAARAGPSSRPPGRTVNTTTWCADWNNPWCRSAGPYICCMRPKRFEFQDWINKIVSAEVPGFRGMHAASRRRNVWELLLKTTRQQKDQHGNYKHLCQAMEVPHTEVPSEVSCCQPG